MWRYQRITMRIPKIFNSGVRADEGAGLDGDCPSVFRLLISRAPLIHTRNGEFHTILIVIDEQPCTVREQYADLAFPMPPDSGNDLTFQKFCRSLRFQFKVCFFIHDGRI